MKLFPVLLATLIVATTTLTAQSEQAEFASTLQNFQDAVKRGDMWKIAGLSNFPLKNMGFKVYTDQEINRYGNDLVRNVLIARGKKFFSAQTKHWIAKLKPRDFQREVKRKGDDLPDVPEGSIVYSAFVNYDAPPGEDVGEASHTYYFVKFPGPETFYFVGIMIAG